MYMFRFYFENCLLAAVCFALGAAFLTANEKNMPFLEKLTRNRIIGLLLGYPALFICVGHARLIAPAFMQSWLWPLALLIPAGCYFYIDFFAARALGGVLIISAYDLVHYAYELRLPGSEIITIIAWLYGIAGIWMSGLPWALRDWFRFSAKRRSNAVLCASGAGLAGLAMLGAVVLQLFK